MGLVSLSEETPGRQCALPNPHKCKHVYTVCVHTHTHTHTQTEERPHEDIKRR